MLGIVSNSYAEIEDPPNTFQVLSLSAIGGADFPKQNGWTQKHVGKWGGINPSNKGLTYICKSEICEFDIFTSSFGTSLRVCQQFSEVTFRENVLVIPPTCADPTP